MLLEGSPREGRRSERVRKKCGRTERKFWEWTQKSLKGERCKAAEKKAKKQQGTNQDKEKKSGRGLGKKRKKELVVSVSVSVSYSLCTR